MPSNPQGTKELIYLLQVVLGYIKAQFGIQKYNIFYGGFNISFSSLVLKTKPGSNYIPSKQSLIYRAIYQASYERDKIFG